MCQVRQPYLIRRIKEMPLEDRLKHENVKKKREKEKPFARINR
jgi:hypothetical protein